MSLEAEPSPVKPQMRLQLPRPKAEDMAKPYLDSCPVEITWDDQWVLFKATKFWVTSLSTIEN